MAKRGRSGMEHYLQRFEESEFLGLARLYRNSSAIHSKANSSSVNSGRRAACFLNSSANHAYLELIKSLLLFFTRRLLRQLPNLSGEGRKQAVK